MSWQEKTPRDPEFANKIRKSFALQEFMKLLGAKLGKLQHGEVEIILPASKSLNQQHGFFHGGAIATIADSAAGYSALTMFEAGAGVLTSEFKINFLRPARADQIIAKGKVIKPGKLLSICQADVFGDGKLLATALLTMAKVSGLKN